MKWIYEANILIHVFFGLICLVLGAYLLIETKGNNQHKKLGKLYVLFLLAVVITSIFIKELNKGELSLMHLLSVFIFLFLAYALFQIKQKKIHLHKRAMIGIYSGLVAAGILSVSMSGRYLTN